MKKGVEVWADYDIIGRWCLFDCMVEQLKSGDRSKETLRYFWNRGYTLYDMEQLARGEEV